MDETMTTETEYDFAGQVVPGGPDLRRDLRPAGPSTARSLYDLPIFGWAWTGDAECQADYDREVYNAMADEAYETLVDAARYDTEAN